MGIKRSRGRTSNAASLFFVIFSCFSVVVHYSSSHAAAAAGGKDTITQGKEVGDSDFLVSAGGIFKLGFFNTSKYHYLGIWYNKGEPGRIAWVANRDTPIIDRSGALLIDGDGKLKITYGGGNSIVLNSDQTTTTKTTVNVTATLLDSGNFVLRGEEISNGSAAKQVVLWQSFDHPTDTLLPGMKLGFNLKTGRNWSLTSWVSGDVPAPGAFTLGGNPNGTSQLILRRRGDIYWTSGVWDSQILNFVPPINLNFDEMNFSYISNKDENYLTYSVNTNSFPNSMWTVGPNGKLVLYMSYDKIMTTIGHIMIDCSRNEKTDHWGCANERRLECRKGDEVFEQRTGYMRSDPYERDEDASLGLSDCDTKCWSNCSCIAYASSTDYGTGCQLWGGEISFEGNNSVQNEIYVLYSHSEVPYHPDVEPSTEVNPNASKKKLWVWFIIAVAATILMLLSGFLCYLRRGYFRPKGEKDMSQEKFLFELGTNVTPGELRETNEFQKEGKKDRELKLFSLASIMHATSNFSSTNKLGEGGFGPVYKGILPEGREIAVKRLSRSSGQGLVEFKNEIILIAKLQHMNLVRLLGCCLQEEEKILVYEYMPNRSLDSFVFDPTKRELLDWKKRFNIVEGITQGLLYLHKYSRLRVIHRDLKASNILLDDGMNPKISDFGMARIFGQNEIEANTNRVVGTYGYMSPEYAMDGIFSVKSDVYSYGVLLLEIMSGRRNTSFYNSDRVVNLTGYAWSLWKEGTTLELMDPMLGDSCPAHKLLRCIHIGLLCVQESPRDRPTMSDVASMLMNDTMPLPSPKQPAFFLGRNSIEIGLPKGNSENCSLNNMSISVIEAR